MTTHESIYDWRGRDLHGEGEEKIGTIDNVYLDVTTDQPAWLAVKTGLLGSKVTLVPLASAVADGDHVDVPYSKDMIKDAPSFEAERALSEDDERRVHEYYGVAWGDVEHRRAAPVGRDTSGPTTDSAMTRSEEELAVGKRTEQVGRARLRKYVVTENVQATVPVTREEVRIEREPITDANVGAALDGPAISEEEHEVTLHAEQPVIEKRVVPQERVRLAKDAVVEEEQISDQLRKEQIEADADAR